MDTRALGSLTVSVAGLGCNNFGSRCDEEQTAAVVGAALDEGVTFFDTADIYGGTRSEEFLGRALREVRDEVVIATKFGHKTGEPGWLGGGGAGWVARAAEASLRRLGTDRIDLYQMHLPDPEVPIAETLGALDELVRAGKVVQVGCSNFSAAQIAEAEGVARARGSERFVGAQNHYNLLHREVEQEVLPACEAYGLGMLPYFPLASGFLTGKYRRGEPPPEGARLASLPPDRAATVLSARRFDVVEGLEAFCAERGHTLLELAMSWTASRPTVASVIAGATKPEQVRANVRGLGWRLTADEEAAVDAIAGP